MKLLFYSKYCKHCSDLFRFKENSDDEDFNKIKKICVDDDQNLPKQITKVPTLVSNDLLAPIVGKEVFAYFNCLEMFYQQTNNINYWNNKAIKRPVVDHFIPGKEQSLKYQPINEVKPKNQVNVDKLKRDKFNN
ncbi:hypothetical protein crov481 [Cafeteria roenbergensis virus]|uniref:Thioredoxin domain-containing protein n=1 Tax=Cafeteria roenbergensis virus (strain BV-PW1) TaxID=693272 RepID=E3T5Q2_CROVB|nr:hypothetical protein crov481 [Cafeteria roenbergensis virus BV-PW1]ADO67515.1 hypothetical protein crov481 [Cafeteria roenbergensis virus BV-PW1]